MRIWNTENWQLEKIVSEPFQDSPSSTFFRRLRYVLHAFRSDRCSQFSWSPDGAFIAASNAMNGPIFVGAVIERESWGSQISFVGHSNTIQVAVSLLKAYMRRVALAHTFDRPSIHACFSDRAMRRAERLHHRLWR